MLMNRSLRHGARLMYIGLAVATCAPAPASEPAAVLVPHATDWRAVADANAPRELAQLTVRREEEDDSANPEEQSTTTASSSDDSDNFVFAGDLARQLRRIDQDAKVDWDGKKLIIKVKGQEFALFPDGSEMVINGEIETQRTPLRTRNDEIYVPADAVQKIGRHLESTTTTPETPETTVTATPEPTPEPTPELTPTPTPTPEPISILPDTTPSTTPATATNISVLPDVTPATVASPSPSPSPSPRSSVATPFPIATPTPTPVPTPTPTPTPRRERVTISNDAEPGLAANTEAFRTVLRDKISVGNAAPRAYTLSQLEERAARRNVDSVLIYADGGTIPRDDKFGRESARIALEVANRVAAQLNAAGIQTQMLRTDDNVVPAGRLLENMLSSEADALLIISVGYSTEFADLGGYRVFYMDDSADYHSMNPRSFDASEAVPTELNYRPFQEGSKVLASSLKNSIATLLEREPVGTSPVPQYLARRAPMAACSVVVGYSSNPADERRLTDTTQQDAMASALVQGLRNYMNQVSQGRVNNAVAARGGL